MSFRVSVRHVFNLCELLVNVYYSNKEKTVANDV